MLKYTEKNVGTVLEDGSLRQPETDVLGNPYSMSRVSMRYLDATHFVLIPTGFREELPPYEAVADNKRKRQNEPVTSNDSL